MVLGGDLDLYFCVSLDWKHKPWISTDPGCICNMDPDMVLGFILGIDVTMAVVVNACHSDQHGPSSRPQVGLGDGSHSRLLHCL